MRAGRLARSILTLQSVSAGTTSYGASELSWADEASTFAAELTQIGGSPRSIAGGLQEEAVYTIRLRYDPALTTRKRLYRAETGQIFEIVRIAHIDEKQHEMLLVCWEITGVIPASPVPTFPTEVVLFMQANEMPLLVAEISEPVSKVSAPVTVVFAVIKDLRLDRGSPTTNRNGVLLQMGRQGGIVHRTILQFDLSSIPGGSTITSATLDLVSTLELSPTWSSKVKRLTTAIWGETTATWNTSDGSTAWSPANDISPQTGPYTETDAVAVELPDGSLLGNMNPFSITGLAALAQDAVDNRSGQLDMIILADDETVIAAHRPQFSDREDVSPGAAAPSLTVVY